MAPSRFGVPSLIDYRPATGPIVSVARGDTSGYATASAVPRLAAIMTVGGPRDD